MPAALLVLHRALTGAVVLVSVPYWPRHAVEVRARTVVVPRDRPPQRPGRSPTSRVRTADLVPFARDARRCFPGVGGALVHKDELCPRAVAVAGASASTGGCEVRTPWAGAASTSGGAAPHS